ncbi:MAG: hypothetical protein GY756_01045 [bacterium]|nr:hypothetical protein [bacterium]
MENKEKIKVDLKSKIECFFYENFKKAINDKDEFSSCMLRHSLYEAIESLGEDTLIQESFMEFFKTAYDYLENDDVDSCIAEILSIENSMSEKILHCTENSDKYNCKIRLKFFDKLKETNSPYRIIIETINDYKK